MIDKFEKKINDWKEKIDKKMLGVGIFMIFGAITLFSLEMTNNFKREKQKAQDEYNKAMYQMVGYVNNVEMELAKLQITNNSSLTTTTLASIWRQSNLAKESLESLPVNQNTMEQASKYLTQVSDFSYSLMKQSVNKEKITDEQFNDIKHIYEESRELATVVSNIYEDLNSGRIKWDELEKVGNKELSETEEVETVSNVEKIGKTFQEYEGLIYDGAFSDHLLSSQPKWIENAEEVTEEKAMQFVVAIFGEENVEYINATGESSGTLELYNFEFKLKGSSMKQNISITKKGCKVYLMISDRKVVEENVKIDEAKQIGLEFLKKIGIEDVKDTYYLKIENMAIINYAAVQNDVILYPDLVKVKIALDTGEVCSVESQGYIFNHTQRKNIKPQMSEIEAKSVVNPNIDILKIDVAVIPTDSKKEILVYECKGKIDEREFLIYINANTLQEEKVLLILDTPGGILTM